MINQNMSETLSLVNVIKNKEDRINKLREICYTNNDIASLVQNAFHKNVDFADLPADEETLRSIDRGSHDGNSSMYKNVRKLHNLNVKRNPIVYNEYRDQAGMTQERRLKILVGMFENITDLDANLLISVVLFRKLPYRNMSEAFVREAMPELFENEVREEENVEELQG